MQRTSISDNLQYPVFCYMASKNEDLFKNFKNNPVYTQILEHVTADQGLGYLQIILSNPDFKFTPEQLQNFFKNDSVGNPRMATYNIGDAQITCSPTTLRYLKVLSDIISLFDTEKIKSVAEIGIGYAGQCRILMNALPIDEYNLIDLPEVLALAEKFLDKTRQDGGGSPLH